MDISNTKCLDRFNYARDHFNELMKRWDNRLTLVRQSIVEKYIECVLTLVFDLDIIPSFNANDIARNDAPIGNPGSKLQTTKHSAFIILGINGNSSNPYHWNNKLVFVDNVEIVKGTKSFIPSSVRFYDVDNEISEGGRKLLYYSTTNGSYKIIFGFAKRKLAPFRVAPGFFKFNLTDNQIKGCPCVMDSISDDKGDCGWNGFGINELKSIVSGISVILDDNRIVFSVDKLIEDRLKIKDMLLGPFNL